MLLQCTFFLKTHHWFIKLAHLNSRTFRSNRFDPSLLKDKHNQLSVLYHIFFSFMHFWLYNACAVRHGY